MTADRWVLTVKEGVDTLHRNPREQCNLDDTDEDFEITETEALKWLETGSANPCQHCAQAMGE